MEINKEKLPIIFETINKNDVDAWIIMGRETIMNSEPVLPVLGDLSFIISTTLIFTREKLLAIVSPLDVEAYKMMDGVDEVYEYPTTMQAELLRVLSQLKPVKIAINSSSADSAADGLTYGNYLTLKEVLDKLDYQPEIVSSFPIIAEVRGRKTASQIALIKDCAIQAEKYLTSLP